MLDLCLKRKHESKNWGERWEEIKNKNWFLKDHWMVDKIKDLCSWLSGLTAAGGADSGQYLRFDPTQEKRKTERGKQVMPFTKCTARTKRKGEMVSEHKDGSLLHTTVTAHCLQYFAQRLWRGTETQPGAPKKVWSQNWRNYRLDRCCTRMESEGGGWHIKTNRREQEKKADLTQDQTKSWRWSAKRGRCKQKRYNEGIKQRH